MVSGYRSRQLSHAVFHCQDCKSKKANHFLYKFNFYRKKSFNYSEKTLACDKLKSYFNNNKKNTTTFYRNDSLLKNS